MRFRAQAQQILTVQEDGMRLESWRILIEGLRGGTRTRTSIST